MSDTPQDEPGTQVNTGDDAQVNVGQDAPEPAPAEPTPEPEPQEGDTGAGEPDTAGEDTAG